MGTDLPKYNILVLTFFSPERRKFAAPRSKTYLFELGELKISVDGWRRNFPEPELVPRPGYAGPSVLVGLAGEDTSPSHSLSDHDTLRSILAVGKLERRALDSPFSRVTAKTFPTKGPLVYMSNSLLLR